MNEFVSLLVFLTIYKNTRCNTRTVMKKLRVTLLSLAYDNELRYHSLMKA